MTARAPSRRYVIDASVVVKWVLDDEEHVEQARALRDACLIDGTVEFHAPELLVYELTNAIRKAAYNTRLPQHIAQEALTALLEAPIELHAPDPLAALEIGLRLTVSGYDANYVALADALGVECWSGDERLVRACERPAPYVRSIGEYEAA
ncbi:MAG: type II toxin-antitoxin system VapC family toxin [Chloroflexota bacterium]|nr:type II toxin-antitoxin system VapC family toxin [Chloroflexota bacterium]